MIVSEGEVEVWDNIICLEVFILEKERKRERERERERERDEKLLIFSCFFYLRY